MKVYVTAVVVLAPHAIGEWRSFAHDALRRAVRGTTSITAEALSAALVADTLNPALRYLDEPMIESVTSLYVATTTEPDSGDTVTASGGDTLELGGSHWPTPNETPSGRLIWDGDAWDFEYQ